MKTEQGDFPEVLIEGEQSPRGFPGRNEDRPRGFPGSVVSWECQRVAAESVTRHRERNMMKGEAKKLAETLYAWNQELLRRSSWSGNPFQPPLCTRCGRMAHWMPGRLPPELQGSLT